jgi:hypothetical protein
MFCQQPLKIRNLKSTINNAGLDQLGKGVGKGETISCGLNIWWNLNRLRGLLGKPGSLIRLLGLRPEYPEFMHPRSQGTGVQA